MDELGAYRHGESGASRAPRQHRRDRGRGDHRRSRATRAATATRSTTSRWRPRWRSTWTGGPASSVPTPTTGLVTVRSGTSLRQLNADLHRLGLAMANLGDIDAQTIAGAMSTGTHGTGAKLGVLATQIEALETGPRRRFGGQLFGVRAAGAVQRGPRRARRARRDQHVDVALRAVVRAARQGVARPAGRGARGVRRPLPRSRTTSSSTGSPHSDRVIIKRNNRIDHPAAGRCRGSGSSTSTRSSRTRRSARCAGSRGPCRRTTRPLNGVCGALVSERVYSDYSHNVFVTPRRVRFVETEYAVPRAGTAGRDRASCGRRAGRVDDAVIVPCEVRVAAADDIWLSTAQGRDTAYISMHQALGMPYRSSSTCSHAIAASVGGRPHWGKMHNLDRRALRDALPALRRLPPGPRRRRPRPARSPTPTWTGSSADRLTSRAGCTTHDMRHTARAWHKRCDQGVAVTSICS